MKRGIVIAVIVVVALGLVFTFFPSLPTPSPASPRDEAGVSGEPPATGNVDDAAAAILRGLEEDQLPTGEDDPELFLDDAQTLDSFGQSLDANQFE